MRPHLFGPVDAAFAHHHLADLRRSGTCLTFGAAGTDLPFRPTETWSSFQERLPTGWRPGFVALWLGAAPIPDFLWSAPVPLVGVVPDWHLSYHLVRRVVGRCERVLTDTPGVAVLHRAGFDQARPALLGGLQRDWLADDGPDEPRDIDILVVGPWQPAVDRERLAWVGRLAPLAERYRLVIASPGTAAEYAALLRRARITFQPGATGACPRTFLEAACCGSLVVAARANPDQALVLEPGREFVAYGADDWERWLDYYLTHEDERRAVAAAARQRARASWFAVLWGRAVEALDADWDDVRARQARRAVPDPHAQLLTRTWHALSGGAEPTLVDDLTRATGTGGNPELHNALGLAAALATARNGRLTTAAAAQAAPHFRDAVATARATPVATLNLIETLVALEQKELASDGARRLLAALARGANPALAELDGGHFPPVYDLFRVEWERAAWANAGAPAAEIQAKVTLLSWRLHVLLGELTGELLHYHEAAVLRPDLPATRAALGCALGRAGQFVAAAAHLRVALEGNPLDRVAARALHQALTDLGAAPAAERVARARRSLHAAAPGLVPAEPWFVGSPPGVLASIIIPCCNEAAYTRLCLDSLLRYTRPPYEVIVVDNGSTDDTPALLASLRGVSGPTRLEVVRYPTNLGFATACNQGVAAARGEVIVFLNNDVVLTAGWLDGLLAALTAAGPDVALVGPVTNYAPDPQCVAPDYSELTGLADFAARRRQACAGRTLTVARLTGFCLLARRDVLARVGVLDERYTVGFFEDDDLCVRVRQAGLKLLVALDVYVHHFGSRTFQGLGLDTRALLAENFARFKDKWGAAEAAPYRLPAAGAAPLPRRHLRKSLCLIVKNEERYLPDCLNSVAGLFDEIIVVDTGSTDRTKEIALAFGARVFDFPWVDHFAAARNEALRHATGDWIFWLDADDRIPPEQKEKLRALLDGLRDENAAFVLKCDCDGVPGAGGTTVDHLRLFRNRPDIRWEHRVHEQILSAVRRSGGDVRWADVRVRHVGYADPSARGPKLARDLRLLHLELAERPDHPFTLFNLGSIYHEQGRHAEALDALRRSLEHSAPQDSIVRKLYALIAHAEGERGRPAAALAAVTEGLTHYSDDAELLYVGAELRARAGDSGGAIGWYERLLASRPGAHFASVAEGLRGYKSRHNLAVQLRRVGRVSEAERHWHLALAEKPDFLPALFGLGELLLGGKRWSDLEALTARLATVPGAEADAEILRARAALERGEYPAARARLEPLVAADARAVLPRVVLADVCLCAGGDVGEAERLLLEVLALEPGHVWARTNLEGLHRRQAAARDAAFVGDVALAPAYHTACATPSDIHEHLPTLYALAQECRHVTELGTRTGVSTTAFLYAQPDVLVSYDLVRYPEVERLARSAGRTAFAFRQEDVLLADIEATDLLFIDTWHVYEQLQKELALHGGKVRKYIVLHDTTTFGEEGETAGHRGLWPAVEEYLQQGTFRLKERFTHNNGLTVLERVAAPAAAGTEVVLTPSEARDESA